MAGRCSLQLLGSDGRQARLSGEREAPKTHVQGKGTSHVQGEGDRETTLPSECHFTTTPVSLDRRGGGGGVQAMCSVRRRVRDEPFKGGTRVLGGLPDTSIVQGT